MYRNRSLAVWGSLKPPKRGAYPTRTRNFKKCNYAGLLDTENAEWARHNQEPWVERRKLHKDRAKWLWFFIFPAGSSVGENSTILSRICCQDPEDWYVQLCSGASHERRAHCPQLLLYFCERSKPDGRRGSYYLRSGWITEIHLNGKFNSFYDLEQKVLRCCSFLPWPM